MNCSALAHRLIRRDRPIAGPPGKFGYYGGHSWGDPLYGGGPLYGDVRAIELRTFTTAISSQEKWTRAGDLMILVSQLNHSGGLNKLNCVKQFQSLNITKRKQ